MTAATPGMRLIRLALPSKGHLHDGIVELLRRAGYRIRRASERHYEATIDAHDRFAVVFMRPSDIVTQVNEGRCQLGVTGYDVFAERAQEATHTQVISPNLGYGACRLVAAVPESWIDVYHMVDLVDLTADFKASGKSFRVSTKYHALTKAHFHEWGMHDFQLVDAEGALELHPSLGIADIIVDLVSSGTTLKDNRLREIEGGTLLESAACLIGHVPSLHALAREGEQGPLAHLLDAIDGVRTAEGWLHFEAVGGPSDGRTAAETAVVVASELDRAGAQHVCRGEVWDRSNTASWRATGLIRTGELVALRRLLWAFGVRRVVAMPARFVFDRDEVSTFDRMKMTPSSDMMPY